MGKRKRKKGQGYFCWCCGRMRPNERFSRWGRMRHVCKVCQRLGAEELGFRQAVRNIDRTRGFSGAVRRKHRATFERFLSYRNPRVRAYAQEVQQLDVALREQRRREYLEEELALEALAGACDEHDDIGLDDVCAEEAHAERPAPPWYDIPF